MPTRPSQLPILGGLVALILVALVAWFFSRPHPTTAPTITTTAASTTTTSASTTSVTASSTAPSSKPSIAVFAVDSRDTITSWTISGAFSTEPGRSQKLADVEKLTSELPQGIYTAYDIYIGIAQDYELIGDGQNAYRFYLLAAENQPGKGLAFNDLGSLMQKLGVLHSAETAYARSVKNEPTVAAYQLAYLRFLAASAPHSSAAPAAFASARAVLGNNPDVIIAEANWKEAEGDIKGAINDWQAVRPYVGAAQQAAIDAKIAKLSASPTSAG